MDGRRLSDGRPGRYDPFMKCGRAGGRVRANMRRETTPRRTATGGAGRLAQTNYKCRTLQIYRRHLSNRVATKTRPARANRSPHCSTES